MIKLISPKLALTIDEKKLSTLAVFVDEAARAQLVTLWDAEQSDLSHYLALFVNPSVKSLSDQDSFISLSFSGNGYILDSNETIDLAEAQKQIEIDLEIISRESQWNKEESIYFDQWWPKPQMNPDSHIMEFGVSLKDYQQNVFNRTINRILLTRFGYLSINYSLSEADVSSNKPLSEYQKKLDEVVSVINIDKGYRFIDIDEDNDMPSKSRMINLLLSSEIF